MTVSPSPPVRAVVNVVLALDQSQQEHCHGGPPVVQRVWRACALAVLAMRSLAMASPLSRAWERSIAGFRFGGRLQPPGPGVGTPQLYWFLMLTVLDETCVRVEYGAHMTKCEVEVVGVDKGGQDSVGPHITPDGASGNELAAFFVTVAHRVGRAGKDSAINVQGVVIFIIKAFPAVGQDLHLANAHTLLQVNVLGQLGEDFLDTLAGIFPRLASGDIAVCEAPGSGLK